jgi:hypothetical protein
MPYFRAEVQYFPQKMSWGHKIYAFLRRVEPNLPCYKSPHAVPKFTAPLLFCFEQLEPQRHFEYIFETCTELTQSDISRIR